MSGPILAILPPVLQQRRGLFSCFGTEKSPEHSEIKRPCNRHSTGKKSRGVHPPKWAAMNGAGSANHGFARVGRSSDLPCPRAESDTRKKRRGVPRR